MKLAGTTLFLILIAATPAFSLWEQNDQTAGGEPNYKEVNGFSGYLTVDDEPREHVREWLSPEETVILRAMPTMKRGKTMGAFVELMVCKQDARRACNVRVKYTIYKPDGSIFAARAVRQNEILWKKKTKRTSYPLGLARMNFRLGRDDPAGDYKVKAEVSDLNAGISFEIELSFYLR